MLQILINESSSEVCFIYEPGVISTVNMLTKFIFIIKFDGFSCTWMSIKSKNYHISWEERFFNSGVNHRGQGGTVRLKVLTEGAVLTVLLH